MLLFHLIHRRRRRGWLCGSSDDEVIDSVTQKKNAASKGDARFSVEDTRTGSSSTAGDESSSSNDSRHGIVLSNKTTATPNVPKWKAGMFIRCMFVFCHGLVLTYCYSENFLTDGPFEEADWWEDCDDFDSSNSSSDSENDDGSFLSDDDESRVSMDVEQLQKYYAQQRKQLEHESQHNRTIDSKVSKRFCNRGLQTWCQSRQVWLSPATKSGKKKKAPPIPESFRKELIQCLVERRQFELSQSIPLSCVVNAYEQVWTENGCD
jgi:hypothetical protein